jgi:hypothetical protein
MKKIRCAVYTRKSSDDGLEQEFNSLHAQHEACASYIASQKHEGWVLLPEHYDDGGISGGTLERGLLPPSTISSVSHHRFGLPWSDRTTRNRCRSCAGKRGGRKQVLAPVGASWIPLRARVDNTMVKAITRAHRWKRLLESERFASVTELAEAEKINQSYLCRVLRLTLLAPDIVEAILDGRQPHRIQLEDLLQPHPAVWSVQRERLLDYAS